MAVKLNALGETCRAETLAPLLLVWRCTGIVSVGVPPLAVRVTAPSKSPVGRRDGSAVRVNREPLVEVMAEDGEMESQGGETAAEIRVAADDVMVTAAESIAVVVSSDTELGAEFKTGAELILNLTGISTEATPGDDSVILPVYGPADRPVGSTDT